MVLRLESEDDRVFTGAPEFAAAVERLSGGSLRIELVQAGLATGSTTSAVSWRTSGRGRQSSGSSRSESGTGSASRASAACSPRCSSTVSSCRSGRSGAARGPHARRRRACWRGRDRAATGPVTPAARAHPPLLGPESYAGTTFGIRPGGVAERRPTRSGPVRRGTSRARCRASTGRTGSGDDRVQRLRPRAGDADDERRPLAEAVLDRHEPRGVCPLTPAQRTFSAARVVRPPFPSSARSRMTTRRTRSRVRRGGLRFATASPGDLAALRPRAAGLPWLDRPRWHNARSLRHGACEATPYCE